MEEEGTPEGSPVLLSNPGTPLTTQMNAFKPLNLATFDTEWNADCVEWCPIDTANDILVCGTYQLVESDSNSSHREGCIYLLRFSAEELSPSLRCLQRMDTGAAILDIKWSECLLGDHPTLIAANAKGDIEMYQLKQEKLELMTKCKIEHDLLLLSVDWLTKISEPSCDSSLVASDSSGSISLFCVHSNCEMVQLKQWKAHGYEAWIVAIDRWQPHILYSGGDDCLLKGWDTRQTNHIFKNSSHHMGVTAIASNPFREHILATGSYDESVMVWDSRLMKAPLSTFKTGGGVWRLKWDPQDGQHLLAACMHHGVVILNYNKLDHPRHLAHYAEHTSMAYGVDWHRKSNSTSPFPTTVASCSFYDHSLRIWTAVKT